MNFDVDKAARFGLRGDPELVGWLSENGLDADLVRSFERETCDGNFLVAEIYRIKGSNIRYLTHEACEDGDECNGLKPRARCDVAVETVTVVERVPPTDRILAALEAP